MRWRLLINFEYCFSKSFNSILVQETKVEIKPVFWHILRIAALKGNKEIETMQFRVTTNSGKSAGDTILFVLSHKTSISVQNCVSLGIHFQFLGISFQYLIF